jgi:hypothetical protein
MNGKNDASLLLVSTRSCSENCDGFRSQVEEQLTQAIKGNRKAMVIRYNFWNIRHREIVALEEPLKGDEAN